MTVSISQSFNMPTNHPHDLLVDVNFPPVSNYLRTTAIEKYSYQGCMFDDVPRSGNQAIPVPKVLEIRCWTGSPACMGISIRMLASTSPSMDVDDEEEPTLKREIS